MPPLPLRHISNAVHAQQITYEHGSASHWDKQIVVFQKAQSQHLLHQPLVQVCRSVLDTRAYVSGAEQRSTPWHLT